MAISKRVAGVGAAFLFAFALIFAAFGPVDAQTQYCEIALSGCPEEYDGDTLAVPLEVIAMSTQIRACGIVDSVTGQGGDAGTPPAIVFIIDHSGSMNNTSPGHDRAGNRFRVTRALIDSIYAVYPQAEVGLVFFDVGLSLDARRDSNLVVYGGPPTANSDGSSLHTGSGANRRSVQGYMPLRPLNAPARREGGPGTGTSTNNTRRFIPDNWQPEAGRPANPEIYDLYRSMFTIPVNVNNEATITGGPQTGSGTNISIAFKAALETFATTTIPKENQYIIFLSDGEPNPRECAGNAAATAPCRTIYSFMHGEDIANTPTTYTVFLNNDNISAGADRRGQLPMILDTVSSVPWGTPLAPNNTTAARRVDATLYQVLGMTAASGETVPGMTYAIRNNGYSETNLSSDIWVLQANYEEMLRLMMDNIITPMLSKSEGNAKSIVISTPGASESSNVTDGQFTFRQRLPIDTSDVMRVAMDIRYDVRIDSTWTLPGGGDTTVTRVVPDSLFNYEFWIRRTTNPPANWQNRLTSTCANAPTLSLQFRGETLASSATAEVKEVKGNMDVLTIVFDNTGGLFLYDGITVQVMNADSTFTDIENITLTRTGTTYTGTFPRVVAEAAVLNDGRLQHASQDSIILVFRNPQMPLDTIRIAAPYVSTRMAFYETDGDPAGKTPIPENITVVAGDTTNLFAKFFDSDDKWDPSFESDPARITWTVSDPAGNIRATGAHGVFTSETSGRTYSVTATYRDGPLVVNKTVHIEVVPGPPAYLQIVADTAGVAAKADTNRLKQPKEFEFDKDTQDKVFYVVTRDRFGNLIGPTVDANWESNDRVIAVDPLGDHSSALVAKNGTVFSDNLFVVVEKDGITDTLHIKVIGETSVAIGPNPFVPGKSNVAERLQSMDPQIYETYKPIIDAAGGDGKAKGVLIAATAPKSVQRADGSTGGAGGTGPAPAARVSVIIYDAVGNVVFRSKRGDVVLADDFTFGFIWDGKNNSGRTVGPGTYLVRIVATLRDGTRFSNQRMIGVTTDGNTRNR